ncbi:MAG TPA: TIGR00730 family Rossman fold protein [Tepidisphaeraceae bacterium]
MIQNVTVYCASSLKVAEVYREAARSLGRAIALRGWGLVYGGDRAGLMGLVADGAASAGGKVIGIMPERMMKVDIVNERCSEMVAARDMRHRKEMLEGRGDAMIALPGGLGTLEEFFEVVVGRQLGFHSKPIVLLNIAGYFGPLLAMFEHGIEHQFIKADYRELFFVAATVEEAIGYLSGCETE